VLVEKILFLLIQSEICGYSADKHIQEELTEETYKELFTLSHKHDMAHIVASALSRCGLLKDDETSASFRRQLMKSLHRDAQRERAIELTTDLLEQAHIPHILLKGSVLCHLYPQTWMRTSCDIDVLVHKSDIPLVETVLCSNQFSRLKDSSMHDYSFISPNRVHIEIHHTLTQDSDLASTDAILESVWDEHSTLDDGYTSRYSMTPELFILYHVAHMGRHLLHGGCGVRPFIDLWLIKKHMPFDKEKLSIVLKQVELLKLYEAALALGEVWLEHRQHDEGTSRLESFILNGGVYGTTTNAAKVQAASGISRVRSFTNMMFLSRQNLEVLYPGLKKHPLLLPFYQVRRWFRIVEREKQQKVKHFIDVRNSISKNDENSAMILLQSLGLLED